MDNIIIEKVINNNIISAYEKSGAEVIVMGRGIGFKKKQGEVVPTDQISKIFRIKSRTLTEQFKELLANMPLERVRISDEIISHAKDHLKLKLNQSIYVTLTDHINFAIERVSQGIEPQNALLWEIKRFYPQEFQLGIYALELIQCAKDNKKKVAIGLVASAALCAFICGVTEPFEFGFMFLAPGLYVIYALLYGIFTVVTVLLGFRAGFSFSAGATDLLFSASLPAAQKTWLIIPLGIAAFIVFYVVFRFAILKFNLKTPGREDDDTDETTVKLANDNFTEVAKIILEGVGGKGNVASIDNCITRLRLEIKDYTAVDEKKIKSAGVAGVIRPGKNSVQVVIGTKVQFVADEFKKLCK